MAALVKIDQFVEDCAHKVHDLETDQIKVALTNTAPTVATDATYSDLTSPIANTNLGGAGAFNVTTTSSAETSGTYKLILVDLVLTATGAAGPFQYIVIYNDTPTSPADPLIAYYDYGSAVTLANTDTFTCDFDGSGGFITLA